MTNHLTAPFAGFRFSSPDHVWIPVAAVLSILWRDRIRGPVPGFLFTGQVMSGKTALVRRVAAVAGVQEQTFMWRKEKELAKTLLAFALNQGAVVAFDNVGNLRSESLAMVLTAHDVTVRRIGLSKVDKVRWHSVVMLTGRTPRISHDMDRRVLTAHLAGHEASAFDRDRFLSAASSLRGVGKVSCRGSFEAWAGLVGGAIMDASGVDVVSMIGRAGLPSTTIRERPVLETTIDAGVYERLKRASADSGEPMGAIVERALGQILGDWRGGRDD